MFTGIIERTATIHRLEIGANSVELELLAPNCDWTLGLGDSLAVNGCCLTVVAQNKSGGDLLLKFDLLRETWSRTSFQGAALGNLVNLERSLEIGGRLHGHFVSGHVDGLATIRAWEQRGKDWSLDLELPSALRRYLAPKGSIAVDGISLTVSEVTPSGCLLWIIPHTRSVTNLHQGKSGDQVNIETDILAKYVESLIGQRA